jgi:hypothetical protein
VTPAVSAVHYELPPFIGWQNESKHWKLPQYIPIHRQFDHCCGDWVGMVSAVVHM